MQSSPEKNGDSGAFRPTLRIYLTKRELVERSGLSASTIQRYKDGQRIPYHQPGGKGARLLFPSDAIEAAVAQARQDGLEAIGDAAGPRLLDSSSTPAVRPKLPGPRPRWQTINNKPLKQGE